jgi:hypothetical protein
VVNDENDKVTCFPHLPMNVVEVTHISMEVMGSILKQIVNDGGESKECVK